MSDKFIKFGPAWLRDFGREGNASNFQNQGTSASNTSFTTSVSNTGGPSTNTNSSQQHAKVQLAKLRYGREEILALYTPQDSEPPAELKHLEHLYNSRGKPPLALINTFDDDSRDNARGGPPAGGTSQNERFGLGRGYLVFNESRGKTRLPFIQRNVPIGRGQYPKHGAPGLLGFPERSSEEQPFDVSHRPPWANGNSTNPNIRNNGPEAEWNNNPNKNYKSRWQGNNTNWRRQPGERRGEDEEWRSSEATGGARPRTMQPQDKWEREWGDKGERGRDKQPWHNRRTWANDSPGAEENLPEWAMDNAEACGGTFDASGAFHGYSIDDSNIPKTTAENAFALSRSHTQGSFSRSKPMDENFDDWWSSEKAKSQNNRGDEASTNRDMDAAGGQQEVELKFEDLELDPNDSDKRVKQKSVHFKPNLMESKTFDALMRSDINVEEASDERGNFKSVMITPNNSLRQRHQNLVQSAINDGQTGQSFGTPTQTLGDRFMGLPSNINVKDMPQMMRLNTDADFNSEITVVLKAPGDPESKAINLVGTFIHPSNVNKANAALAFPSSMHPGVGMNLPGSITALHLSMPPPASKPNTPTDTARNGINNILNMPMLQGDSASLSTPIMQTSQHMAHNPMSQAGLQQAQRTALSDLLNIPLPGETPGLNAAGITMPKSQAVGVPLQNLQHGVGLPGRMMNSAGLICQVTSSLPTSGICTTRVQSQASALPATNISSSGLSSSVMSGVAHPSSLASGGIPSTGLSATSAAASMPGYAAGGLSSAASSLFMGQKHNTLPVGGQSNMFLHGLQEQPAQSAFGSSVYSGITTNPAEQWYYEDPEKNIQGPFPSSAMYHWHRNGFFTANLMVRRACDSQMRPLGSYGAVPPFDSRVDVYGGMESRPFALNDNVLKTQSGLTDVTTNMSSIPEPNLDSVGYGNIVKHFMMTPNYHLTQPTMVDPLWGQPSPSADVMWMQQPNVNQRNESRANTMPMFLWNNESSSQSSLLPESITKEMKTEEEILAQLRANQNIGNENMAFQNNNQATSKKVGPNILPEESSLERAGLGLENLAKLIKRDTEEPSRNMNQDLEDLEMMIQKESFGVTAPAQHKSTAVETQQASLEALEGLSISSEESNSSLTANKAMEKQKKADATAKTKKKKTKKDEIDVSMDQEQDDVNRTEGSPQTKSKKEKKQTKKEIEEEKKEWMKDGFTIVKAPEKSKDNKKKENKLAEEAERRRREQENVAEEERKRRQSEAIKKQQEQQQQRASAESVTRKAPWSAVASNQSSIMNRDGMTLAEIQRLEREKKVEQMKEQQQMMQLIAQQQQAAFAREQEMQAGLGWSKKNVTNVTRGPNLNEIQKAEARKQAAAANAAAAAAAVNAASQVLETQREAAASHHVWGTNASEVGFWDTDRLGHSSKNIEKHIEKPAEPKQVKPVEVPKKKKQAAAAAAAAVVAPPVAVKRETTPQMEFENWCQSVLTPWESKIDVPTFFGFLKDIESPFEVKDYVKCYLGETKESSDFSRQFLEKRSKLLRSNTRSPADDLCSPAAAVNPRTSSSSDYQEVKGKGKKNKKKMFKVDARILGFSVTAAEDRINVGDIDTV